MVWLILDTGYFVLFSRTLFKDQIICRNDFMLLAVGLFFVWSVNFTQRLQWLTASERLFILKSSWRCDQVSGDMMRVYVDLTFVVNLFVCLF